MATTVAVKKAFVDAAHRDLDKVKELLSEDNTLANATVDWGGGDWETALGACSHTGRREIAEHLLAHGARMDLFAAAMLGKLDREPLIRAFVHTADVALDNQPGLQFETLDLGEHGRVEVFAVVVQS